MVGVECEVVKVEESDPMFASDRLSAAEERELIA